MTNAAVQVQPTKGTDPTKPVDAQAVTSSDGSQVRIQVTQAPKPEDKKGEQAGEKPAGDRPAWLPEKFKSPEDLAKAYTELEKKQSTDKKPEDKKADEKPAADATPQQVTDVLKAAGLDRAKYDTEFEKDGKLSDASYAELAAKGFTRELVDGWIEGQRAIGERTLNTVFAAAGGSAEGYNQMTAWAKDNLSKEEVAAYNKTMESGDQAAILNAVKGLHARFVANEGSEPTLVGGGGGNGAPAPRFNSTLELMEAMKDPRYKAGDKAYHAEVERKLKNSNIF